MILSTNATAYCLLHLMHAQTEARPCTYLHKTYLHKMYPLYGVHVHQTSESIPDSPLYNLALCNVSPLRFHMQPRTTVACRDPAKCIYCAQYVAP